MANVFSNPSMVAAEALRHLQNNMVMAPNVYRGYEKEWDKRPNGWNVDDTVTVKAPVYFRVKTGRAIDRVDLKERSTTFVVNKWRQISWQLNAEEMTLSLDKWSERFLKPAMQALANYIDLDLLGLYKDIPNQVGTPGTTPNTFTTFALAGARLDEEAAPYDSRVCVIDPQAQAALTDTLKGLFHQAIVGKSVEKGKIIDNFAGFKMYMSQNVNTHTVGTWAALADIQKNLIAVERDATHSLKSTGAAQTILQGDIFTYANVNSVNPVSGQSTGQLRQFVVNAGTVMDGAGEVAALTATPGTTPYEMNSSLAAEEWLPYQNIDTLAADGAAVTVAGTTGLVHKVNLAFHRDCLGLVMVPIEIPASAPWKARVSQDGYTMQVLRYMDGDTYTETIRFDILYGIKTLNPFLGCRIAG